VQHDGLGTRRAALDARWGHVEILDVSQELSTPIAEVAVRAAASRLPRAGSVLSPVHAIERTGSSLRVISGVSMASGSPISWRRWMHRPCGCRTKRSLFAGVLQRATRRREGARALLSELFSPIQVG